MQSPRHTLRPRLLLLLTVLAGSPAHARPVAPEGDLDRSLAGLDETIGRTLASIETTSEHKARAETHLEGIAQERATTRRRLRVRARALYRISRAGLLPLAGGFESLLTHFGRLERLEQMVRQDLEALRKLEGRGRELREQAGALAAKVARAKERLRELEQRKQDLELERRHAHAFEAAFADSRFEPGDRWDQTGGLRVVDDGFEPRGGFASQRGTLALPVSGQFELRDARREGGPGLDFVATPGTPVRVVAEGRVAFSDRYGAYGRIVIVDHGDDYYTVYGGLGEIDAQLGDYVGRGARLGEVGRDGTPPALLFEVRRGTRSLDPRSWLGL